MSESKQIVAGLLFRFTDRSFEMQDFYLQAHTPKLRTYAASPQPRPRILDLKSDAPSPAP